ncbi:MAG: alanine--glyoxylate aminotransferase family protein, partial [Bdellovibrionales bacterium]|nr:alanine--glyoxylate aminotransferase family protein [Bdellovibrionales bacterium]
MNHLNLLTPGPVPMPPEVYQALQRPMTHHRTPEFMAVINHCRQQLKKVFNTQEPVIVLTSTGSGAMESAVVNILSTHDEVLVVVSGKFGERWCDMCNVYGVKKVHELQVPWGKSVSAQEIDNYLQKHPQITAVLTQHCETSTGALHPVKEIAQILKKYPKILFFVDAITAIGAEELKMDEWGVDVICAGSQKAFMMPTGLSFIALSAKAWQASKNSDFPKYYFDLKAELKAQEKNQT